jgi:hypothetical protein
MKLYNFLKRKYPKDYQNLITNFDEFYLNLLKNKSYKVGKLIESNGENKKDDLVIYCHTKEYIEPQDEYGGYSNCNKSCWTGGFEYYYYFSKPHEMHHPSSYMKLVNDL